MNDNVNHPAHYTDGKIEVIDYIEDKGFPYHLGNAIKYISRAGKKDPGKLIEDLRKAVWYINRYIELKEKEQKKAEERKDIPYDAFGDYSDVEDQKAQEPQEFTFTIEGGNLHLENLTGDNWYRENFGGGKE